MIDVYSKEIGGKHGKVLDEPLEAISAYRNAKHQKAQELTP